MPRPLRPVPIDRYVAKSLAEIARELNLTPMGVYYIEQKALRKLKQEFIERGVVTPTGRYDS
jgi:DNA-directed RNA polymerase sigma subunit (sigma70/sigma32)